MDSQHIYDIVVIGGGIQGVGIAADASGRGLSVLLCEQNDLASATSSASSKLIHGGLRYLEHYDFALVRESLKERDILFKTAPYLVRPLRFIVPYMQEHRHFWWMRLGLFIYDCLAYSKNFKLSITRTFNPNDPNNPLKRSLRKGFEYSDATVDDARLTVVTALRAARAGCKVLTRTRCVKAERMDDYWKIILNDEFRGHTTVIKAKAIVNATGPWVDIVNQNVLNYKSQYQIRLIKGSHIVVPKLYLKDEAYVLQHKDGRVIFVVPFFKKFSIIGTTDIHFNGDPSQVKIDNHEIEYLCDIVNDYFRHPIKPEHIVHTWSGVRPLVHEKDKSASENTREYKLELNNDTRNLPLLNVYGGKLTSYRRLAEKAVDMLKEFFPNCGEHWTAKFPLPGGDLPEPSLSHFLDHLTERYEWLPSALALRFARSYGTLTYTVLNHANSVQDLGFHFGHGLYEKEVRYLVLKEWARTAQDILWRRSRLGLLFTESQEAILNQWLQDNLLFLLD